MKNSFKKRIPPPHTTHPPRQVGGRRRRRRGSLWKKVINLMRTRWRRRSGRETSKWEGEESG